MKLLTLLFSLASLYATKVHSVAVHNWAGRLPRGVKFSSFETDVMSLPGYSPNQTYWAAIGWNNGYMGMQTWATQRVFLFSLWDNAKGNSAIMEACSECVTSHFGHEGSGVHIQYFYPWSDGVNYGYRIDYEEDGDYLIYTAHLRIDGEWMLFGKLRVINDNIYGLGYFYQFLENPQGVSLLDTRVGVWSNQCYRVEGSDDCHRCIGGSITHTKPVKNDSWGAGLDEAQTGLWMSIDGPNGGPHDNKPGQWEWYPYNAEKIGLHVVVANDNDWRCGLIDYTLHQCPPGYCCSKYGWCGVTEDYCEGTTRVPTISPTKTSHVPTISQTITSTSLGGPQQSLKEHCKKEQTTGLQCFDEGNSGVMYRCAGGEIVDYSCPGDQVCVEFTFGLTTSAACAEKPPAPVNKPEHSSSIDIESTSTAVPTHSTASNSAKPSVHPSCECAPIESSSGTYMNDFLITYQNQGYLWDVSARDATSQHQFDYKGVNAEGKSFSAVTTIQPQKAVKGGLSISAKLYECFKNAEITPGINSDAVIPTKCSVFANNHQLASMEFSVSQ